MKSCCLFLPGLVISFSGRRGLFRSSLKSSSETWAWKVGGTSGGTPGEPVWAVSFAVSCKKLSKNPLGKPS